MKKTFSLQIEGKHPERLLEATKHEIRKYMQRERRRVLPAGVDFWDFDCRFGPSEDSAQIAHPAELIGLVDALARQGATQFYMEILAKHGVRRPRAATALAADADIGKFLED